jgi:hypothetical protein
LLSLDNMDELAKVKLASGQALEFILAVPGRRYGEFVDILGDFQKRAGATEEEIIEETCWNGLRQMVTHNPIWPMSKRSCAANASPSADQGRPVGGQARWAGYR